MPPHPDMRFDLEKVDSSGARAGTLETSRGSISTPVFMPVATRGAIRALTLRELEEIDFDIILANTYHLYIRPGVDLLERAGGLHRFMNFHRPILTDSGGFQVFSLADLCRVRDNGVEFRSHLDGSLHFFSPTGVLDIQKVIGSDIMMVLDQCVEYPVDEAVARGAMGRTLDWAGISAAYWRERFDPGVQSLFAIVQGGVFPELRRECCERLVDLDLPGYAIGGLSVGEPRAIYQELTAMTTELLPADRPRYMMGVGSPMEILYAVKCGVDMFDCVMPTRIARNGTIYTSGGRINIKAASLEYDFGPLDGQCSCYVCRNFSRSYLRHLFRMGEIAALVYNTYHNLFFMKQFMEDIRSSILNDSFASVYRRWESVFGKVRTSPEGEG
jgi:queuine tRNA-ribosyltransferase